MHHKRLFILFGLIAFCSGTIALVTNFSLRRQPGNFERILLSNPTVLQQLKFPANHFYVAGFLGDTVLLGTRDKPDHIYFLSPRATTVDILAKIKSDLKPTEPTMIKIDRREFYLVGITSGHLLHGNINNWIARELVDHPVSFSAVTPVSRSTYALTTLNKERSKTILALERSYDTAIVSADNILQPQIDGIFSTDGMLMFNESISKLVYVYYYRNQFMVMDTTLTLIYRGYTIDSTTLANIKVVKLNSTKETVLDTPPNITNARSAVDGQWLFVNSTIIARNERPSDFVPNSVIDCYDLSDGHYAFSFYLPDFDDRKVKSFAVHGNTVFALYRNHLVRFAVKFTK